ncbi:MAG: Gfo/Idh/MocA family protein [Phycisphaerales bacterium]
MTHDRRNDFSRRDFMLSGAGLAAASLVGPAALARGFHLSDDEVIRVGVIGCGGRGTGAAHNALDADPRVHITALADAFQDRLSGCRNSLIGKDAARATVSAERGFVGFDAYAQLLAAGDVDVVILATPPHFRPMHFDAAVTAGKHVFMEKPVATDPAGIRTVLAAAERARAAKLSVVAGTQRRHEACYLAMMEQIQDGAIGDIVAAQCYWNQGGLWVNEQQPNWSDMEWQLRNWLYFTWLSGDHIVEQHVHNLDVCNWAIGSHPAKCMGMGGRQVRTEAKFGNIFDHFAIEYEYPDGQIVNSQCRQIDGCAGRVAEVLVGTNGRTWSSSGQARITHGPRKWRFDGENPNPYVVEHQNLIASLTGAGQYFNEAKQVAESTLTAIMGRMSAYTGKEVTWEQALESSLDLAPPAYAWSSLDVPPVAVPGTTALE